jgi:CRP-like cAMP-binding protein
MSKAHEGDKMCRPTAAPTNRLLALLPPAEFRRLQPELHLVPLNLGQILYEARAPIRYAYFLTHGLVSAVLTMQDGSAIEVATVGSEGVVGLPAFNRPEMSFTEVIVQIAGVALRMEAAALEERARRNGPFRRLLLHSQAAFLARVLQTVACNGLHTVQQRCSRWLLEALDRVEADELSVTHEALAQLLGVRRAGVSEAFKTLQAAGLVRTRWGKVTILDREGLESACCECYRAVRQEFDRLLGGGSDGPS